MAEIVRILSDIHFGDPASRVRQLHQLEPLLTGTAGLVFNGDTLDTRPSLTPEHTAKLKADLADFQRRLPPTTLLTGNHDPDFSPLHLLDLADGRIWVTHGDILFDTIVPWSRDVPLIERLLAEEAGQMLPAGASAAERLDHRIKLWRRVAGRIPQRHQSEPNPLKYVFRLAADTIWPPHRLLRIIRSWRAAPRLAAHFLREYRPAARFIVTGHTHHPGVWRMPDGRVVINTGSFSRPLGAYVADVLPGGIVVRRVVQRRDRFHPGPTIAQFSF